MILLNVLAQVKSIM